MRLHRIGRTGRAGRQGEAITFFTDADKTLLRNIAMIVKRSGGEVPEYMLKLKKASRQDKRKLAKTAVKREGITKESRMKNFKNNNKSNKRKFDGKNSFKAKKAKFSKQTEQ